MAINIKKLVTTSINDFKLSWRWTDSNYLQMPNEDLRKILPLNVKSANEVFKESLRLIKKTNIEHCGERCITSEIGIEDYLKRISGESQIIVSWDNECAVLTTPNIFIKYWDDFCYPSSDDVSIWSESEHWFLQYFHFEQFSYVTIAAKDSS